MPLSWLGPCLLVQLRCGGVLEAVRISCAGYPTKMPFLDFIDHFWMLGLDSPQQLDDAGFVRLILRRVLCEEGWQLGKSKVGSNQPPVASTCSRRPLTCAQRLLPPPAGVPACGQDG